MKSTLARLSNVSAASGVTGAGYSPRPDLLFAEVAEDFRAYAVGNDTGIWPDAGSGQQTRWKERRHIIQRRTYCRWRAESLPRSRCRSASTPTIQRLSGANPITESPSSRSLTSRQLCAIVRRNVALRRDRQQTCDSRLWSSHSDRQSDERSVRPGASERECPARLERASGTARMIRVVKSAAALKGTLVLPARFAKCGTARQRVCASCTEEDGNHRNATRWARKATFISGRRVTSESDLDLLRMVLSGLVNKRLVDNLVTARHSLRFGYPEKTIP